MCDVHIRLRKTPVISTMNIKKWKKRRISQQTNANYNYMIVGERERGKEIKIELPREKNATPIL
jgi:hypothetical protein